MCYSVYLSTDSDEDLGARNSALVRFKAVAHTDVAPYALLLQYRNPWFVGSKAGCSCTFRHLHSIELGFGAPVDWYPEEQDEIDATRELHTTLVDVLSSGHCLDLIDAWEGARVDDIITLDVTLDEVSATTFRLFENHRFRLRIATP
jgi:hypothetical protein